MSVCRVWSVELLERSLRDLGLAAFDPCVNLIFSAVLFINGLHVLIQIEKVSWRKTKAGLYEVFLVV